MSNVTNLELSKELYAVSGFLGESGPDQEWYEKRAIGIYDYEVDIIAPKYRLGYLLRKLPWSLRLHINKSGETTVEYMSFGKAVCRAKADTPENAAAKLCIELFKQNILTREKE